LSLISDLMSDSVRATGLSALMKGAGLVTRFIPIPQPTLLVGPGSSARLGQAIAGFGHSKILIVTDSIISKLGLLKGLTDALTEGGARFVVFDEITPDAPIPLIEKAIDVLPRSMTATRSSPSAAALRWMRPRPSPSPSANPASRCASSPATSRACAHR
jgi:hypothetical protein